jgi:hypothetical protein
MKQKKYTYDYPQNREIGKKLNAADLQLMAAVLGFSTTYMRHIFLQGKRTNNDAIQMADVIIKNKEQLKQQLNSVTNS